MGRAAETADLRRRVLTTLAPGCQDADIDLRPGDLLVAFTDGVTEALNIDG